LAAFVISTLEAIFCVLWQKTASLTHVSCLSGLGLPCFELHYQLPARCTQQRQKKFFKDNLLFRGQQIDVPFVIKQKGADANDCSCQIAGSGNAFFNLVGSFVYQVSHQGQVYIHIVYSNRFNVCFLRWWCVSGDFKMSLLSPVCTIRHRTSTTNRPGLNRFARNYFGILQQSFLGTACGRCQHKQDGDD